MAEPETNGIATASVPAASQAAKAGVPESIELSPKLTLLLEHGALVIHGTSFLASEAHVRTLKA